VDRAAIVPHLTKKPVGGINILGWLTTAATFAATIALIVTSVRYH